MARGLIRKFSLRKILGAYKGLWKRWIRRLTRFGYGRKGMGWLRDPKRAWYNFWYHRTSISLPRLFGVKSSGIAGLLAAMIASLFVPEEPEQPKRTKGNSGRSTKPVADKAKKETATPKAAAAKAETPKIATPKAETVKAEKPKTEVPKAAMTKTVAPKTETPKSEKQTRNHSDRPASPEKPAAQPKTPLAPTASAGKAAPPPLRNVEENVLPGLQPEPSIHLEPVVSKIDEIAPKSMPQHPEDRYIRKRMILAGSMYGDREALGRLAVGTRVELAVEADNPYDKNAVILLYQGKKIGYVPKEESFSFATCIRMKQAVYGVITEIIKEENDVRYEFETWFAHRK